MIKSNFIRFFENIDGILMSLILFLISLGFITLASASQQNILLLSNQLINILIGLIVLVILSNIDPRRFIFYSPYLYIFSIILLICVYFFGFESHGAKRWIKILFFNLQPSEIIKITIPLMIAWLYHRFQNTINYKIHLTAFILRGIKLIGIHTESLNHYNRKNIWEKISLFNKKNRFPKTIYKEIKFDLLKKTLIKFNTQKSGRFLIKIN